MGVCLALCVLHVLVAGVWYVCVCCSVYVVDTMWAFVAVCMLRLPVAGAFVCVYCSVYVADKMWVFVAVCMVQFVCCSRLLQEGSCSIHVRRRSGVVNCVCVVATHMLQARSVCVL